MWFSGTRHTELYGLLLPTFCLLLVVTSHLVLEVFARQLLLSGIVSPRPFLRNSHNIPSTFKISLFPLSCTHCLVTDLSASDSFSTMALYKIYFLTTYLLTY